MHIKFIANLAIGFLLFCSIPNYAEDRHNFYLNDK